MADPDGTPGRRLTQPQLWQPSGERTSDGQASVHSVLCMRPFQEVSWPAGEQGPQPHGAHGPHGLALWSATCQAAELGCRGSVQMFGEGLRMRREQVLRSCPTHLASSFFGGRASSNGDARKQTRACSPGANNYTCFSVTGDEGAQGLSCHYHVPPACH